MSSKTCSHCGGKMEIANPSWKESLKLAEAGHGAHIAHQAHKVSPALGALGAAVAAGRVLAEKFVATHYRCKRCGRLESSH